MKGCWLSLATLEEAVVVKRCLSEYERLSGQVVNYRKSSICFSCNTPSPTRDFLSQFFDVEQASDFGKYLGLPPFLGRNKANVFSYIHDKIHVRMSGWSKKLLSKAGEEILLKTVAQAMPQFAMSVFLLPSQLCQSIEKLMNSFWWGGKGQNSKGIHWMSWTRMAVPKNFGGLGFKQVRAFNVAMLGKQGWRFLTRPEALVSRVFKARYFPTSSFLEAHLGANPSSCWRSILESQSLLLEGIRRRVGNGRDTLIWGSPWLNDSQQPCILTERPPFMPNLPVEFLIESGSGHWKEEVVREWFLPVDVQRILALPLGTISDDNWYWEGPSWGAYSVKEGYRRSVGELTVCPGFSKWRQLWRVSVAPKLKVCVWRALRDILPTISSLNSKVIMGVWAIWKARNKAVWER
ncbi:unnamed protein product [Cuscuta campestris]|uniref:Reverse transcriptase zinc-binding domain-containing protein n=1 Tax=Cuscuta campestris TaxID=132261 RepID=A0A484LHW6_9ASTE|nr:unnamed protein product [Cuscuta campestris]